MAATHRGNRRAAGVCGAGMRRPLPPRLRARASSEGPSARSSNPRPSLAYATSPPSSGDPKLPAQRRKRSLRSLYCCSDGVRGRGAPVTYLSHTASFHSNERIAPSNRGIKHLDLLKPSVSIPAPFLTPELLTFVRAVAPLAPAGSATPLASKNPASPAIYFRRFICGESSNANSTNLFSSCGQRIVTTTTS